MKKTYKISIQVEVDQPTSWTDSEIENYLIDYYYKKGVHFPYDDGPMFTTKSCLLEQKVIEFNLDDGYKWKIEKLVQG